MRWQGAVQEQAKVNAALTVDNVTRHVLTKLLIN